MNSAIIVAAGSGKRMNASINKQFIKLKGKEIIAHTISAFYNNENINQIIVCIRKDEEEFFKEHIIKKYNFTGINIAFGGKERQDSIYNSLKLINDNCDIVLIHDGARPFIDNKIIDESIELSIKGNSVVVGVPVKDTIKVVNSNIIESTPIRETLWSAQTPQTFNYNTIIKAYEKAYLDNFYGTDDSSLVENMGEKVIMLRGSYNNIKITSPEDINIGENILSLLEQGDKYD